ncbi:hypothetical protein VNO78_09458 [Psophocarpus tetragonolobus]|uniref:PB1 domain-containing protein n=1 Tax=Psophocarpus tetragonolobus TaxID=3891 RepID=A0AAN9SX25_PSOTE
MEPQTTPPPPPADSLDSSPRSSWDEPYPPSAAAAKLRLMCSYGGQIVPRPHDKSLCYVGGDTRIVVVPRHTSLSDLSTRLSKSFLHARPFLLKYQLPSEDLDSLVSVTTDEDFENMIDEYDHRNAEQNNNNNNKPSRIRLFLFPTQSESSAKSEEWLSGSLDGALSESASVNCLLGLDDDALLSNTNGNGNGTVKHSKEVSDSPVLETNSSFGSGSSAANLPPVKVRVEDQKGLGVEEQFAQMGVGQKQEETFVAAAPEFDHGVPVGYRKPPTPPLQPQPQLQPLPLPQPPQFQPKPSGLVDLPSPDSLSCDSSLSNPISRPKPAIYQDQVQIQSGNPQLPSNTSIDAKLNVTDSHGQIQMQQHVQEPGYLLQPQFDQQPQPQHHQTQQSQLHQPQQYIHSTHLIHHTPAGPVSIPAAYYPVYQQPLHPQQQQFDQQYPVYYVQTRQAQPYNLSVQPANGAESVTTFPSNQSQNQSTSAAYNPMTNPKSEIIPGAYRAAPATPQLVRVPHSQHQQQYVAYSQIHQHHPQAAPPNSAVPANYAYNYADPAHAQIFYTQPLAPSMPSQYQTLPEVSAQVSPDSMKQQVRTSQPM